MPKSFEGFFGARHSIKPKGEDVESEKYKGISEKGVELAKERARNILEVLEEAKEGAVMFLGGASEAVRTKSTAEVFGEEIKRIIKEKDREDIEVFTKQDIVEMAKKGKKSWSKIVTEVAERIKGNPDKKFLVDFPMFLKEFGMAPWMDKAGKDHSDYTKELLKKYNDDSLACLKDWIANEGKLGDLQGPDPTEFAKQHLKGMERLKNFAEKHLGTRPLIVGAAGHSWNLDVLAIYLANEGRVNLEGLEKVGGEEIGETEMVRVEIDEKGVKLVYKGKEYPITLEGEKKKE